MTYFPGMYCDGEQGMEQRIHDVTELHRKIYTDGMIMGFKIGLVAGAFLVGLGVLIAWPW
jgi:hypothetical protein